MFKYSVFITFTMCSHNVFIERKGALANDPTLHNLNGSQILISLDTDVFLFFNSCNYSQVVLYRNPNLNSAQSFKVENKTYRWVLESKSIGLRLEYLYHSIFKLSWIWIQRLQCKDDNLVYKCLKMYAMPILATFSEHIWVPHGLHAFV